MGCASLLPLLMKLIYLAIINNIKKNTEALLHTGMVLGLEVKA
jgi:hypothetical protein